MIGVVLWSDPVDRKAVFWCEDQGDLAYFDGSTRHDMNEGRFTAGDMVEFDLCVERKFRKAVNASLVQEQVCTGLQDKLRESAAEKKSAKTEEPAGNVVAFRGGYANSGGPMRKLKA